MFCKGGAIIADRKERVDYKLRRKEVGKTVLHLCGYYDITKFYFENSSSFM